MAHDHSNHHHGSKNIKFAFFLNLSFTIIEIVGGLLTNSLAILSDALHDLGDSLSIGLSWYFQNVSEKGRDKKYSYGYKRFSLLGAIINAIVLLTGSAFILTKAIPGLLNPNETDAKGMLILAVFGVIVNGAAVLKLRKGNSINEEVISIHLLEDVLGWLAVLIGSLIMMFYDLPWIDPLLSLLIALFIIFNVVKSLRKSFSIILQATPQGIDVEEIERQILSLPEITDVHDCHIWTMDGAYNVLSVHLKLDKDYSLYELSGIKKKVKELLINEIQHVTIEFEGSKEDCDSSS